MSTFIVALAALAVIVWAVRKFVLTEAVVEYLLTHYRGVFATIFLLPVNFLFENYLAIRHKIAFALRAGPAKHKERVQNIQQQILDWIKQGSQKKLCTARPNWQNMSTRLANKSPYHPINTLNMVDILDVNTEKRFIRCEPLVTVGQITGDLLPMGWTLPVLPELDDLTVGGLIMGYGVESTSHKYGLFQDICLAFELILPNGEWIRCTKDENSDLFYAIPWSYGTLGFLVAAELQIMPAKKFVHVKYEPFTNRAEALKQFEQVSREAKDEFVECLQFSKSEFVLMTGNLTDQVDSSKVNPIGQFWKPWFFSHVQKYLTSGVGEEFIPLRDYYHRHSRSLFWEMRSVIPFGNQAWFRYLFGWATPLKIPLLKLSQTETTKKLRERFCVVQDLLVPMRNLDAFLKLGDEDCGIYPVWICPMKIPKTPVKAFLYPLADGDELFVDVGYYGPVNGKPDFDVVATIRKMEKFLRDHGGFQALYDDTYLTRDEFYQMFHHDLYLKMRNKYNCDKAFPEIYDKVCKSARY